MLHCQYLLGLAMFLFCFAVDICSDVFVYLPGDDDSVGNRIKCWNGEKSEGGMYVNAEISTPDIDQVTDQNSFHNMTNASFKVVMDSIFCLILAA